MMVDVSRISINDGWSQERSNWRKEKLELVSAVASAVNQLCVIFLYIVVHAVMICIFMFCLIQII